ncbi:MFS transporter [Deinococcus peraridilitoris]|uniref:Arabinose efflux permease family protein n=1 Tax=Deinococcus peraridilitoris (strain DSM 19664 / LMG 22246 / CIP 109416 / KR-200) TaxID=937777 RepID=L0A8D2_DEIPD|nr:MFS transporter [Deinococcus peraridilitoris]AFZ69679.1 arabinose efflux permease family protein [Deinococcus peraridilitoris DSM 19664]
MTTPAHLPDTAKTRGFVALLLTNLMMNGGFFMVIPLISVHYVNDLGWAAGTIGLVLAARQMTQQGLTVFGGALSDRLGPRGLILTGLLVRALGFGSMGWANDFTTLLAAALLSGVGGSLFDAPKNAAVAALTSTADRTRAFSLMGVTGNLGMVIGPLIGAALLHTDFQTVALASAFVYVLAFFLLAPALPQLRTTATTAGLAGLGIVIRDRRFVIFTVLLMGYSVLVVQLNVAVTLKGSAMAGSVAVPWLYGVNAGLAIALQYPLLRLAERLLPLPLVLILGVGFATAGLAGMALATTFPMLLGCVAVFALGMMLGQPTQQTLTAQLAQPGLYGAYFGFGALSMGVGGALGNAFGGGLYDLGNHLHFPALPWLTFAALGALTALGLWWHLRVPHERTPKQTHVT